MLSRRSLLWGLVAAPAVIRTPGLLMPIKAMPITLMVHDGFITSWTGEVYNPPLVFIKGDDGNWTLHSNGD